MRRGHSGGSAHPAADTAPAPGCWTRAAPEGHDPARGGEEPPSPPPPPRPGAYLGARLVVVLLRADPAPHQVVAHRVRQREEVVAGGGHIAVLDQREVQMPVEALLQLGHVLHAHDAADADLPPLLLVGQGLGHGGGEQDVRLQTPGGRTGAESPCASRRF